MVRVFITVDTELWPDSPNWPHIPLSADRSVRREIDWYFYGGRDGPAARGVPYQLRVLAEAGLKATYFIDPIFSFALGVEPLRTLARMVRGRGQEIGLHIHPEWLTDRRSGDLPNFAGPLLHGYSELDQSRLVQAGMERLREVDAGTVTAFRAGSWGANLTTLDVLSRQGIRYDSSLNARFDASFPDLSAAMRRETQPFKLKGVWEFPVTNFIDRPPHGRRPLHVCAASLDEFRAVLEHASASRWFAVVIVLHSFEFVRVDRLPGGGEARAQRLLAARFERLCEFLASNADRFRTSHFADLDDDPLPKPTNPSAPVSTYGRTARRYVQQMVSRFY